MVCRKSGVLRAAGSRVRGDLDVWEVAQVAGGEELRGSSVRGCSGGGCVIRRVRFGTNGVDVRIRGFER